MHQTTTPNTDMTRERYDQLCSDLAVALVKTLETQPDYQRLGIALEALMRVHRGFMSYASQQVRADVSLAMAAYAGELMSPAAPRTNQSIH